MLSPSLTEFQVVAATWRLWFFGCNFHIYSCRDSYPTPSG